MLALTIMLVPTIKVKADTYTTKDSVVVSSQYYDFFESKFGEDKEYKFFPYNCSSGSNNNRTCYYGIDKEFNYIKIYYNDSELDIETGIDENFQLIGNNVYHHKPSINTQLLYAICFIFIFYIVYIMTGVIFL